MKNSVFYLLLPLFFLLSCGRGDVVARLLLQAENCMESHPDSSLRVLRQLVAPEQLQGCQQADYALLMTQAMHKNALALTDDSLISVALRFYENSDNALRKGQSYYYSGIAYEEQSNQTEAFDCYLRARNILQGSEYYKLLGLVHASIGRLYYEKGLYRESLACRKRAASFFLRVNDSLSVSISARSAGRSYLLLNQLDSAIFYLEEAYRFATTDERRIAVQCDKQVVYMEQGEFQKGADVFLQVINQPGRSAADRACSYLALGDFYLQQGERERAQSCFSESLKLGNVETQAASTHLLYHLKKEEGDCADALAHHEGLLLLLDSTYRMRSRKEIVAIQLKYDREQVQLALTQKHMQLWISLFVATLLLLLVLFLWRYYRIYRTRKEGELTRIGVLLGKTQAKIIDYKSKLVVAEQKLDASQQNKEGLLAKKEQIEAVLHQKEGMLVGLTAEKAQLQSAANQLKLLLSKINKPIQEDDFRLIEAYHLYQSLIACPQKSTCHTSAAWDLLFLWTDAACRMFYTRLRQAYPLLKKRDLQICCLIKLGFSNDEIRQIFDVQPSTFYTDKNNVKHRLGLKEGDKLENWLFAF